MIEMAKWIAVVAFAVSLLLAGGEITLLAEGEATFLVGGDGSSGLVPCRNTILNSFCNSTGTLPGHVFDEVCSADATLDPRERRCEGNCTLGWECSSDEYVGRCADATVALFNGRVLDMICGNTLYRTCGTKNVFAGECSEITDEVLVDGEVQIHVIGCKCEGHVSTNDPCGVNVPESPIYGNCINSTVAMMIPTGSFVPFATISKDLL
jgi:hypothetical protein